MSEFHWLVVVLFSAMFSFYSICSNFRNCLSQNMEPFSLRSTSWGVLTARVMMNCLWYDYFFVMLETEESISEGSSFQEQFSRTWDFVVLWPCLQMSQCRRKVCVNDKKTLYFHFSSERIKFQKFALSMHWKSLETTLESRIDSFLS